MPSRISIMSFTLGWNIILLLFGRLSWVSVGGVGYVPFILTTADKDQDGELNDNELRTLGVQLHGAPLKQATFKELKVRFSILKKTFTPQ